MCLCNSNLVSALVSILNVPRIAVDTDIRASYGHGRNQSIVQAANRAGNFLARSLNFYPTGENARIKWR